MSDKAPERRNKPGRPGLEAGRPSLPVMVRMRSSDYSAAALRAGLERRSVPDLVRSAVKRYLADPEDEQDD